MEFKKLKGYLIDHDAFRKAQNGRMALVLIKKQIETAWDERQIDMWRRGIKSFSLLAKLIRIEHLPVHSREA